jgi:hypothetical protein
MMPDCLVAGKEVALKILFLALLFTPSTCLRAGDDPSEVESCTFVAHTPVGTLGGACTTQNIPTPGFKEYWKLTLTFDQQSAAPAARLQADYFYDMFRSQSLENGSSTLILPLWGDFFLKPGNPEYLA